MCTPRLPTRSISPCSTSTVACASVRARWLGVTAVRKCRASVPSLQLGTSSRSRITRARRGGVEHRPARVRRSRAPRRRGAGSRCRRARCGRRPRCPGRRRGTRAAPRASVGAEATIALVMPVSTAISGGTCVRGLTSVWNSPDDLAAAHLDRADLGDPVASPRRRSSPGRPRSRSGPTAGCPGRRSSPAPPRWSHGARPLGACSDRSARTPVRAGVSRRSARAPAPGTADSVRAPDGTRRARAGGWGQPTAGVSRGTGGLEARVRPSGAGEDLAVRHQEPGPRVGAEGAPALGEPLELGGGRRARARGPRWRRPTRSGARPRCPSTRRGPRREA